MKKRKKPTPNKEINTKSPYKTFKIPLKTILVNKPDQLVLNDLVLKINDLVIHTYQFIRLFILNQYTKNLPLQEINEKFILYCMKTLGTRDKRGVKRKDTELLKLLDTFYITEYQPLLKHQKTDLTNNTFLLPYLATQIYTSYVNNIQERFVQHFFRFIKQTTNEITKNKLILLRLENQILNEKETDKMFDKWKKEHLSNILPKNIEKSVYYDLKIKPFDYLKGMMYMTSVLEKQKIQTQLEKHKLFQVLSLRTNIIPKHITLDTASLISLFCPEKDKDDNKTTKTNLMKNLKANQHEIWENFLDLDHKIFRNKHYHFRYQIQTDGISCSLLFIRNDLKDKKRRTKLPEVVEEEFDNIEELSEEELDKLKDRNIIGCDPGKQYLVYMTNKDKKKLKYSASQRRRESKAERNQKILLREKERKDIFETEKDLSLHNSKTVDYEKFKKYLVEKDKVNKVTSAFYQRDTWRKMKFRQYSYGKKSVDKFLNKIKKTFGDNLLIGYGNWSQDTQMKNFMPTMNKGLRKLIHKKYETITINEYYTSQKCCECEKKLHYHKDKYNQDIYRLLVCSDCFKRVSSKNKRIVFRTRDANAATNIMNITKKCIAKKGGRPLCFQNPCLSHLGSDKQDENVRPSIIDFTLGNSANTCIRGLKFQG